MKLNLKKILISLFGIFLLALFILMTIYLLNRKVSLEYATDSPNPSDQLELANSDTSITNIYVGEVPCEDCDSIRITLSLTKENETEEVGDFVFSRIYLGAERDVENLEGEWTRDDETVTLVYDDSEEIYIINENELTSEDGDIALTLLE